MFDLYLVAAGSIGDAEQARRNVAEAQAIPQANYTGLIPWLTAVVSPERIQQPGGLWVFSSVAADRGSHSNYHYGAAAVPGLFELLDQLDQQVAEAGGRLYLAKDSHQSATMIQRNYPRLHEWRQQRALLDPRGVFCSDLARRVKL